MNETVDHRAVTSVLCQIQQYHRPYTDLQISRPKAGAYLGGPLHPATLCPPPPLEVTNFLY